MALIVSPLIAAGSGKIGGIVIAHNKGGMYFRALVAVTNPNTPAQNFVRATVSDLTNGWSNVLSQAQRDLWETYAQNVPLANALGVPRNVSGINMFVRSNVGRAQGTLLPRVTIAPSVFDLGEFTPFTAPTASIGSSVGFAFTNTDAWANEDDSAIQVWASRPQNASIQYFTNPYRFAGQVDGDAITPPTSPAAITSPFLSVSGQRVFLRVRVTRADGRLSLDQRLTALVP